MIAITDYGMGNLRSVQKALERLGAEALVTSDPNDLARADKVILPGVGAFKDAMDELDSRGLTDAIKTAAAKKPFLGICLGLQLLFEESEEGGIFKGLGILPGRVVRFSFDENAGDKKLKIPHMGWNAVECDSDVPLFSGLESGFYTYFVHSYYVSAENATDVAGRTTYGFTFPCAVQRGNLFATQFHPEKSQQVGMRILQNFIDL